jgi:hypothetical protein
MGKKSRDSFKDSKFGKKMSHTGKEPLVESLTNKGVMVRKKVRDAQERKRSL